MKFEVTLPEEFLDAVTERVLERLPTPPEDRWLTAPEAATYLGCKVQRIHNLVSAGSLPRHKDGGRLLFRRSELDAYVEGRVQSRAGL